MHQCFIPEARPEQAELALTGREARHLGQVLRAQPGQTVRVLNGRGTVWECTVASVERARVNLEVVRCRTEPPQPFDLVLIQSLVKSKALDWILAKAVELGATSIVPVETARSVSRLADEGGASKLDRWESLLVEALKQCGRAWLPSVAAPRTFAESLTAMAALAEVHLVASLEERARTAHAWLSTIGSPPADGRWRVAVWIGPEGDFTAAELAALRDRGAKPFTLGPAVLRSETAALAALALVAEALRSLVQGSAPA